MSYLGIPPFGKTIRTITEIIADSAQSSFPITGGYVTGYVDVYLNGVALSSSDFTATDNTNVVLQVPAAASDEFKSIAYFPVSLVDVYRKSEVLDLAGTSFLAYDSNLQSFVNTFTLPVADGTIGQVLQTNSSGILSFVDVAADGVDSAAITNLIDSDYIFSKSSLRYDVHDSVGAYSYTQAVSMQFYPVATENGGTVKINPKFTYLDSIGTEFEADVHFTSDFIDSYYIQAMIAASAAPPVTAFGSVDVSGNIIPTLNATYDLGSTSLRWNNIYTSDLSLKNAFGDWTIVEGDEDLFLYNNKKSKTYKFALIEVDPSTVPPKRG